MSSIVTRPAGRSPPAAAESLHRDGVSDPLRRSRPRRSIKPLDGRAPDAERGVDAPARSPPCRAPPNIGPFPHGSSVGAAIGHGIFADETAPPARGTLAWDRTPSPFPSVVWMFMTMDASSLVRHAGLGSRRALRNAWMKRISSWQLRDLIRRSMIPPHRWFGYCWRPSATTPASMYSVSSSESMDRLHGVAGRHMILVASGLLH
jgi:hypothetical protein